MTMAPRAVAGRTTGQVETDDQSGTVAASGTVVVTGAGQGIGAAVAAAFAAQGSRVVALDINDATINELADREPRITAYPVDVSDAVAVRAVITDIEDAIGPIGVLVNAAAVLRPGSAIEVSEADWQRTLAVNATGVMLVSRATAQHMIPRRRGAIVTVASDAAGVARTAMAAYAASKAAAAQYTRCLGLELARHGIRCNVVCPGSTDTPMQRALWPDPADDSGAAAVIRGDLDQHRAGIPLGRLAQPSDVADAVLFLASPGAAHITMQSLYVDGGAALRG